MKFKHIVTVLGLPINRKGQVLLTKRHSPHKKQWHNNWQVAGGELELGESLEQALSREFQEELGVSARILFPYPMVMPVTYRKGTHIDKQKVDVNITLVCFLVDIGDQKVDVSKDEETKAFKWFYPREVHSIKYLPMTKEFVEEAEKITQKYKLLQETVIVKKTRA